MRMVLWTALVTLVTVHFILVITNIVAMFVLPFMTPWYVAVPLITYLVNLVFNSAPCPLTRLEDGIRRRLGLPVVKHFVGYYVVWPLKRRFGRV